MATKSPIDDPGVDPVLDPMIDPRTGEYAVIAPGHNFRSVTQKIAGIVLTTNTPWGWLGGITVAGGIAHFTGLPHITLHGDTAVVTSYLQILTPKKTGEPVEVPNHGASRGYHIHRVVTNRWDLVRTAGGWKIKRRTLRLVDGTEPSRELLRGALGG